jgi:hypothetical protein
VRSIIDERLLSRCGRFEAVNEKDMQEGGNLRRKPPLTFPLAPSKHVVAVDVVPGLSLLVYVLYQRRVSYVTLCKPISRPVTIMAKTIHATTYCA